MSKARSLADLISGGAVIEASEIADSTITGAKLASDISITTTGTISTPSITGLSSLTIENVNIDNNSITSLASNIEQVSYTSVTNNLILNSNIISTSTWSNTGLVSTTNSAVAPDGTTTADTLAGNGDDENGSNTNKAIWRDGVYTNVNTTYVLSIHAKPKDNNFLNISVR